MPDTRTHSQISVSLNSRSIGGVSLVSKIVRQDYTELLVHA